MLNLPSLRYFDWEPNGKSWTSVVSPRFQIVLFASKTLLGILESHFEGHHLQFSLIYIFAGLFILANFYLVGK